MTLQTKGGSVELWVKHPDAGVHECGRPLSRGYAWCVLEPNHLGDCNCGSYCDSHKGTGSHGEIKEADERIGVSE